MKIPEKISNSTESASLEFTPFRVDRSFLLCMPLRKSRDYSVVIYIHVSEAFLNIRSNAREKFGSTTRDLKFNRVIFTAPVYKAGVITGQSSATLPAKRLCSYTWNKSFFHLTKNIFKQCFCNTDKVKILFAIRELFKYFTIAIKSNNLSRVRESR